MGFKMIKKRLMAMGIASSILVCYGLPTIAQEMTWHNWSTSTLVQGEKYGIYPLSWYDNMQEEMDGKRLEAYCNAIGKELELISGTTLKKDATALTYTQTGKVTRGQLLESIYEVLNQYTYAKVVDLGEDAITYMCEKQILQGTGKDLKLDKTCTLEEAAVFGTRIISAFYKDLDGGSKGLLWKVQKDNNTIYMLGSIHISNYDMYPLNENILDAYESADVLGVEVNLYNQEGLADYNKIAVYTDGTTLKDHISPELYTKVIKASEKLGIGETDIASCKPWSIATTFSTTAQTNSSTLEERQLAGLLGFDNYFMTNALMNDIPIYELESYAYQANMLDSFSPELQEYNLASAVEMLLNEDVGDEIADGFNNWLKYWGEGNVEDFEKTFPKTEIPESVDAKEKVLVDEYMNKLFTVRDEDMTEKIETLLNNKEGKTYFIVVGAGHYVGEDGVIQNLKDKGYTVEQVK